MIYNKNMINMSRFSKGMRQPGKADIVHSNAIARTAQSDSIGATNADSFADIKRIELNRKVVGKYTNATIHNGHRPTIRRVDQPSSASARPSLSVPPRPITPKAKFSEPDSRPFNPYG